MPYQPDDIGQGSYTEVIGDDNGNIITGVEKSLKLVMFKRNRNRKTGLQSFVRAIH